MAQFLLSWPITYHGNMIIIGHKVTSLNSDLASPGEFWESFCREDERVSSAPASTSTLLTMKPSCARNFSEIFMFSYFKNSFRWESSKLYYYVSSVPNKKTNTSLLLIILPAKTMYLGQRWMQSQFLWDFSQRMNNVSLLKCSHRITAYVLNSFCHFWHLSDVCSGSILSLILQSLFRLRRLQCLHT